MSIGKTAKALLIKLKSGDGDAGEVGLSELRRTLSNLNDSAKKLLDLKEVTVFCLQIDRDAFEEIAMSRATEVEKLRNQFLGIQREISNLKYESAKTKSANFSNKVTALSNELMEDYAKAFTKYYQSIQNKLMTTSELELVRREASPEQFARLNKSYNFLQQILDLSSARKLGVAQLTANVATYRELSDQLKVSYPDEVKEFLAKAQNKFSPATLSDLSEDVFKYLQEHDLAGDIILRKR